MPDLTPKQIVAELDKHIVGQGAAKRAVAIALRNRWRRMRLEPALRNEVTPKNILLIGPTGVGKTEIARRLAHLADAPFVKVEATKFTEVGYVGKDVETIVRDLADAAIKQVRDRAKAKVRAQAEQAAEERVLDALLPRARGVRVWGEDPPPPAEEAAVLALAAQRQFRILAEGEKEGVDGFRFAGSGKGGLPAFALTDPDRFDTAQTARVDRIDRRHIGLAAVTHQLCRASRRDFGLRLRNTITLIAALFCLSHHIPRIIR